MDAAKSFDMEHHPAYSRLALSAELNAFHWEDIQNSAGAILGQLENARPAALIVDLTQLNYLGSAQLTLLVRVWKAMKSYNGRMVVEVTGPVVREVLKTAGLSNVWEFADSRLAAFHVLGLQDDGRRPQSLVLPLVGIMALAAALAGVGVSLWRADVLDARMALVAQLACSSIALAAGLSTAIRGSGVRRGLGAGMVVASAVLAVAVVFNHPR